VNPVPEIWIVRVSVPAPVFFTSMVFPLRSPGAMGVAETVTVKLPTVTPDGATAVGPKDPPPEADPWYMSEIAARASGPRRSASIAARVNVPALINVLMEVSLSFLGLKKGNLEAPNSWNALLCTMITMGRCLLAL